MMFVILLRINVDIRDWIGAAHGPGSLGGFRDIDIDPQGKIYIARRLHSGPQNNAHREKQAGSVQRPQPPSIAVCVLRD